jgi:hypothetical protein
MLNAKYLVILGIGCYTEPVLDFPTLFQPCPLPKRHAPELRKGTTAENFAGPLFTFSNSNCSSAVSPASFHDIFCSLKAIS